MRYLHGTARPDFDTSIDGWRRTQFVQSAVHALTPVLSEPLSWLPLEALSFLVLLGARAMFGASL